MKAFKATSLTILFLTVAFIAARSFGGSEDKSQTVVHVEASDASVSSAKLEVATLAGGCFWCVEADLEKLPGVARAISGYAGGDRDNPTYRQVTSGATKHAEAVQVYYDPEQLSYEEVLNAFWRHIDPTDARGQFVDRGLQYRTAIFFHDEQQKIIAERSRTKLEASKRFKKPIVTEIVALKKFFEAEAYHQDFYKTHPRRYYSYRSSSGRDPFIKRVWGANN